MHPLLGAALVLLPLGYNALKRTRPAPHKRKASKSARRARRSTKRARRRNR